MSHTTTEIICSFKWCPYCQVLLKWKLVLIIYYLVASQMPNDPNGTKGNATNTAISYLVALANNILICMFKCSILSNILRSRL